MATFKFEKALTDEELGDLEEVAHGLMTLCNGEEAAQLYGVVTTGRKSWAVIEEIVKADRQEASPLFPDITEKWPLYVKTYLQSSGWELGCGFVGASASEEAVSYVA